MALLQRFDSPAYLDDFEGIPGQREAWHQFVSASFDASIESERPVVTSNKGTQPGIVQFYNASTHDPGGPLLEQAVMWNAFPKELLRSFGRPRALIEADRPWPLSGYRGHYDPDLPEITRPPAPDDVYFRPQVEYCEWHVTRDSLTGDIVRVTFTSEPPEYWAALFGGAMGDVQFPGSKERLLSLYRSLVDPRVTLEDVTVQRAFTGAQGETYNIGDYNPYNRWNTTHGIAHLCAPPNALTAEIQLGADATVRYRDGAGRSLTQPDALICGAGYGGPNRNSDPTIGSSVNALARLGAMITLANPVGLYMDHIDTTGWELPDGIAARDCVHVIRGAPRMIERMVVEVPPESGRTLADLTIGGDPVRYGGQIAECITVKLVGLAAPLARVTGNDLVDVSLRGLVSAQAPSEIFGFGKLGSEPAPGLVAAFEDYTPSAEAAASPARALAAVRAGAGPNGGPRVRPGLSATRPGQRHRRSL